MAHNASHEDDLRDFSQEITLGVFRHFFREQMKRVAISLLLLLLIIFIGTGNAYDYSRQWHAHDIILKTYGLYSTEGVIPLPDERINTISEPANLRHTLLSQRFNKHILYAQNSSLLFDQLKGVADEREIDREIRDIHAFLIYQDFCNNTIISNTDNKQQSSNDLERIMCIIEVSQRLDMTMLAMREFNGGTEEAFKLISFAKSRHLKGIEEYLWEFLPADTLVLEFFDSFYHTEEGIEEQSMERFMDALWKQYSNWNGFCASIIQFKRSNLQNTLRELTRNEITIAKQVLADSPFTAACELLMEYGSVYEAFSASTADPSKLYSALYCPYMLTEESLKYHLWSTTNVNNSFTVNGVKQDFLFHLWLNSHNDDDGRIFEKARDILLPSDYTAPVRNSSQEIQKMFQIELSAAQQLTNSCRYLFDMLLGDSGGREGEDNNIQEGHYQQICSQYYQDGSLSGMWQLSSKVLEMFLTWLPDGQFELLDEYLKQVALNVEGNEGKLEIISKSILRQLPIKALVSQRTQREFSKYFSHSDRNNGLLSDFSIKDKCDNYIVKAKENAPNNNSSSPLVTMDDCWRRVICPLAFTLSSSSTGHYRFCLLYSRRTAQPAEILLRERELASNNILLADNVYACWKSLYVIQDATVPGVPMQLRDDTLEEYRTTMMFNIIKALRFNNAGLGVDNHNMLWKGDSLGSKYARVNNFLSLEKQFSAENDAIVIEIADCLVRGHLECIKIGDSTVLRKVYYYEDGIALKMVEDITNIVKWTLTLRVISRRLEIGSSHRNDMNSGWWKIMGPTYNDINLQELTSRLNELLRSGDEQGWRSYCNVNQVAFLYSKQQSLANAERALAYAAFCTLVLMDGYETVDDDIWLEKETMAGTVGLGRALVNRYAITEDSCEGLMRALISNLPVTALFFLQRRFFSTSAVWARNFHPQNHRLPLLLRPPSVFESVTDEHAFLHNHRALFELTAVAVERYGLGTICPDLLWLGSRNFTIDLNILEFCSRLQEHNWRVRGDWLEEYLKDDVILRGLGTVTRVSLLIDKRLNVTFVEECFNSSTQAISNNNNNDDNDYNIFCKGDFFPEKRPVKKPSGRIHLSSRGSFIESCKVQIFEELPHLRPGLVSHPGITACLAAIKYYGDLETATLSESNEVGIALQSVIRELPTAADGFQVVTGCLMKHKTSNSSVCPSVVPFARQWVWYGAKVRICENFGETEWENLLACLAVHKSNDSPWLVVHHTLFKNLRMELRKAYKYDQILKNQETVFQNLLRLKRYEAADVYVKILQKHKEFSIDFKAPQSSGKRSGSPEPEQNSFEINLRFAFIQKNAPRSPTSVACLDPLIGTGKTCGDVKELLKKCERCRYLLGRLVKLCPGAERSLAKYILSEAEAKQLEAFGFDSIYTFLDSYLKGVEYAAQCSESFLQWISTYLKHPEQRSAMLNLLKVKKIEFAPSTGLMKGLLNTMTSFDLLREYFGRQEIKSVGYDETDTKELKDLFTVTLHKGLVSLVMMGHQLLGIVYTDNDFRYAIRNSLDYNQILRLYLNQTFTLDRNNNIAGCIADKHGTSSYNALIARNPSLAAVEAQQSEYDKWCIRQFVGGAEAIVGQQFESEMKVAEYLVERLENREFYLFRRLVGAVGIPVTVCDVAMTSTISAAIHSNDYETLSAVLEAGCIPRDEKILENAQIGRQMASLLSMYGVRVNNRTILAAVPAEGRSVFIRNNPQSVSPAELEPVDIPSYFVDQSHLLPANVSHSKALVLLPSAKKYAREIFQMIMTSGQFELLSNTILYDTDIQLVVAANSHSEELTKFLNAALANGNTAVAAKCMELGVRSDQQTREILLKTQNVFTRTKLRSINYLSRLSQYAKSGWKRFFEWFKTKTRKFKKTKKSLYK